MLQGVEAQEQPKQVCGDPVELAEQLEKQYGETPVAFSRQGGNSLVMVFASKSTSTVMVIVDRIGCIVSVGEAWETLPPKSHDPEA
jgi:hypothetical protein